jgi:hypothetical protein
MAMRIFLLLLAALVSLSPVLADEVWVITSHDTPIKGLNHKRLENIFLRKHVLNDEGGRWIPVNLKPDDGLRQAFSLSLLNSPPEALESYWNEQYFQGITPPYVVASEEAMLRFVATTRGAIGYISPCHLDKRVKVVFKLPVKQFLKGYCNKTQF